MRKKLALGLALALMFSLVACNKPAAEPAPAETVVAEQTVQDQPKSEPTVEQTVQDQPEPVELTQDELHKLFEAEYLEFLEEAKNYPTMPEDIMIDTEIWGLVDRCPSDKALPADYEAQYRAWRSNYTKETTNIDEGVTSDSKPSTQTTQNTNDSGGQQNNNGGSQGNSGGQQSNGGGYNGTGMTLREISKLPDSEKIALGFTQLSNGAWVDSNGRKLPDLEWSEEDVEKDLDRIEDAGIILGSG